jgi:predicted DNA-binding transcriptional regulator AlpA
MSEVVYEPRARRTTVDLAWIAETIGFSHRTACRLYERRQIPGLLDLGSPRRIRYDRARVEEWIKSLSR